MLRQGNHRVNVLYHKHSAPLVGTKLPWRAEVGCYPTLIDSDELGFLGKICFPGLALEYATPTRLARTSAEVAPCHI